MGPSLYKRSMAEAIRIVGGEDRINMFKRIHKARGKIQYRLKGSTELRCGIVMGMSHQTQEVFLNGHWRPLENILDVIEVADESRAKNS